MPKQQTNASPTVVLYCRISPELHAKIRELSEYNEISMNLATVMLLEAGLAAVDEDQQAEEG